MTLPGTFLGPPSRVVLIIGTVLALASWAASRALAPSELAGAVVDASFVLFGLGACAAIFVASRGARPTERSAWTWVLAGMVFWTLGAITWLLHDLGVLPFMRLRLADLAFLMAAPMFITAGVGFLRRPLRRLGLLAVTLDVLSVVVALVVLIALYVPTLLIDQLTHDLRGAVIALLYPILYTGATATALSSLWGAATRRARPANVLFVLGLALNAVAFILWLPAQVDPASSLGAFLQPLWLIGVLAIGAAGLLAAEDASLPLETIPYASTPLVRLLVPAFVAAVSAFALISSQFDQSTATDRLVAVGVAITVLLLAARVGVSLLVNNRVSVQERWHSDQHRILYDVGLEAVREHSVEELVRLVVDHATDITACDGSTLALADPDRGFVFRALKKLDPQLRNSVGEVLTGIGREAVLTRELVVARSYQENRFSTPAMHGVISSAMSAPLMARGEVIGVLSVHSLKTRRFSDDTRRIFSLYAAQAAAAINTAQLLQESRRLASDDDLTGVLNRRSLVERLEIEVAESRRHGDSFCVVICDLDGLKHLNDSGGHLVGDEVLRRVARGLRDGARIEDSVARFGGDEFVLLLPRTSLLQGQALVARIGSLLRGLTYTWGGRELPLPRVSIGVAAFPDDGLTADALLAAADARMYADKSRARGIEVTQPDTRDSYRST